MRARLRNSILIAVSLGFLIFLGFSGHKEDPWITTWSSQDKNAYGGYVTHDLMQDLFPGRKIRSEYRSFYQMSLDSSDYGSLLIIDGKIYLDKEDWRALYSYVSDGHDALLCASYFGGKITKGLYTNAEPIISNRSENMEALKGERVYPMHFEIKNYPKKPFKVERLVLSTALDHSDSIDYTDLAFVKDTMPVLRQFKLGTGNLYLCTMPMLLTNYYMLDSSTQAISAGLLSLLPSDKDVTHVEYYSVGKLEATTPLRYILSNPALKAAYWIAIIGLILFMIFEAKRRQRIIPVIKPLKNSSREFAGTLGQLYYNARKDHSNMARKRINFFLDYVRRTYRMDTGILDENFAEALSKRANRDEAKVKALIRLAHQVRNSGISEEQFLRLEDLLNFFYGITGNKPENKSK